jgi:hypothetical protein
MFRGFLVAGTVLAQLVISTNAACDRGDVFDKITGDRCPTRDARSVASPELRTKSGNIQLIVNEGKAVQMVTRDAEGYLSSDTHALLTAADLESIDAKVSDMQTKMATLDTLIEDTVSPLAAQTKSDLADLSAELKGDVEDLSNRLKGYATKDDISGFATKDKLNNDLGRVKTDVSSINQNLAAKTSKAYVDNKVATSVASVDCFKKSELDGLLRRNPKSPDLTDYYSAKDKKWIAPPPPPPSSPDCETAQKANGWKNGVYKLKGRWGTKEAYCHKFNGNGYTLVARVNGGQTKWQYGETGDNGSGDSAWESGNAFGTISGGSDYKSLLYSDMFAKRFLITRMHSTNGGHGKKVLESDNSCLGGTSLEGLFRKKKWTCGGSAGLSGNSCSNACTNIAKGSSYGDPVMNKNGNSNQIYLHAGERNGAQESNEDRCYISGSSSRSGVDAPTGLGSYCTGGCGGKSGTVNVGLNHDGAYRAGSSYVYEIWYYGIA